MARRGVHFLEDAGRWRRACIEVLSRAQPQGPLYRAVEQVVDTIDGVAEVVAGDRRKLYQESPRTLRPDLSPGKWRTVE